MGGATLTVTDMHTAGEPVRIVEDGYPELEGASLLEKRRDARQRFDGLRRRLMLEPRGHAGMYGVIPTAPSDPTADLAVLFTHQEGYSTMCGHATIAIGRWAVDSGRVASRGGHARFRLEAPCGVVEVEVTPDPAGGAPRVAFESVESFASHLSRTIETPGFGAVEVDVAFGGAYYAILPASRLGLPLLDSPLADLVAAGTALTAAVRERLPIEHPEAPDLGFLYGTILTDDAPLGRGAASYNLCVFAEGQIDRSPTGSGVTARLALAAARGELSVGQPCEIRGVSGAGFTAQLSALLPGGPTPGSRVRVAGVAHYASRATFLAEADDPFADGFTLPERFADLLPGARA
ncbi:MAG: proline racemase family protein [Caulobacterales bacterium]|nr:proline racemase family protein [Caulobacterales bacterium]